MRIQRSRKVDATFDLNLAPVLDIIVSIVPMLLLSVAFLQVRMIETPVPQVVAQKIAEQNQQKQPKVSISLRVSKDSGFNLVVIDNGKKAETKVSMKASQFDFDGLTKAAVNIKKMHGDIFKLDFAPAGSVAYDDIVKTMDAIRKIPTENGKVTFVDSTTGQNVQTDLMFPDIVFSNVVGE